MPSQHITDLLQPSLTFQFDVGDEVLMAYWRVLTVPSIPSPSQVEWIPRIQYPVIYQRIVGGHKGTTLRDMYEEKLELRSWPHTIAG